MRKEFVKFLLKELETNKNIILLTGDLGYRLFDEIRDKFPNNFYNVGASEQAGMGICIGLALEGKIPIFYSISPFAVYRPFETIHIYLHNEQIPVKIVGGGRDKDYEIDGFTHDASDIKNFMKSLNIINYYPNFEDNLEGIFKKFLYNGKPSYLNLRK